MKAEDMSGPLFPLGQVVITSAANEVLTQHDIQRALRLHQSGNWGHSKDAKMNDAAVMSGDDRIHSVYKSIGNAELKGGVTFWVITEWDRSVTTVLLPEDY